MAARPDPERAPLSRATAQAVLVSSLIEVIDCDRKLEILKVVFRSSLKPEAWRRIVALQTEREQKANIALAVWDTAGVFPVGSAQEARAHEVLERPPLWTAEDIAERSRPSSLQSRHHGPTEDAPGSRTVE